jgi:hypothetical protein
VKRTTGVLTYARMPAVFAEGSLYEKVTSSYAPSLSAPAALEMFDGATPRLPPKVHAGCWKTIV